MIFDMPSYQSPSNVVFIPVRMPSIAIATSSKVKATKSCSVVRIFSHHSERLLNSVVASMELTKFKTLSPIALMYFVMLRSHLYL
jgi:hypothetical protein